MRWSVRVAWELVSTVMVLAIVAAMLVLYLRDRKSVGLSSDPGPATIEDWAEWDAVAIRVGSLQPSVRVTAFMDFTCPHCRSLAWVLDSLMAEIPGEVGIDFIQIPSPAHAASMTLAVAAECAEQQGAFLAMSRALLRYGEEAITLPTEVLAAEAGVADLSRYAECAASPPTAFERLVEAAGHARRVGVEGTPTVWLNGRLFQGRSLAAFRLAAQQRDSS